MAVPRLVRSRVGTLLKQYPAVALVGPRQAGKTTLAKSLRAPYYDLEQESERLRLELQWAEIEERGALIVLDEAQSFPAVFPRLRGAIDAKRKKNGRFLLLGSVSPSLMRQVSESLAGRLALCELTPLLLPELRRHDIDSVWLRGGYPDGGVLRPSRFPDWQHNYVRLLAERDLPQWGLPAAPQVILRMLKMLAASQANLWNASDLGRSLGLSYHTVGSYLEYLEGAFLVRRLPPFHANLHKRLVKSPKIYWRDTGLLHALLGVTSVQALYNQPWVGASWEGFVVEQILGYLASLGVAVDPTFFRTSDAHEIDLVFDAGASRWAVEVKLTSAPSPEDMQRLTKVAAMINADRRALISRVRQTASSAHAVSTNLPGFLALLGRSVRAR